MSKNNSTLPSFKSSLYDHQRDGIEVLLGKPAQLLFAVNLTILALIVCALVWAFFAKADVIVTATGTLQPKQDLRRVYPPVDGELRGIYVETGAPVEAGDIIARINARGAVEAASRAQEARLKLAQVRSEVELFPQKRVLLQEKSDALKVQLDAKRREFKRREAAGLSQVTQAQRARLEESRAQLEQAVRAEKTARLESEKYERLFASAGGGGVSRNQVRQKQEALLDAKAKHRSVQARLAGLEYEVSQAISQADSEFSSLRQEVAELGVQYATAVQKIEEESAKLNFKLRSAELAASAAERLSFDNFDEDNYLKLYAPVSGVVTEVSSTQLGEKVEASRPLISIAPVDAERIVRIKIAEKDRGFLKTGLPVKLKFNAFPYRNYGSVAGTLEYISPTATQVKANEIPAYLGRVKLSRETINTPQGEIALTYGMGALAEMVVRERRFIDLALDPLRGVSD
ncbi:MAG: HlyD family efflux transporter periplasmic adaptor subunit [Candidatus Thiodiazotropha taylori]